MSINLRSLGCCGMGEISGLHQHSTPKLEYIEPEKPKKEKVCKK